MSPQRRLLRRRRPFARRPEAMAGAPSQLPLCRAITCECFQCRGQALSWRLAVAISARCGARRCMQRFWKAVGIPSAPVPQGGDRCRMPGGLLASRLSGLRLLSVPPEAFPVGCPCPRWVLSPATGRTSSSRHLQFPLDPVGGFRFGHVQSPELVLNEPS